VNQISGRGRGRETQKPAKHVSVGKERRGDGEKHTGREGKEIKESLCNTKTKKKKVPTGKSMGVLAGAP